MFGQRNVTINDAFIYCYDMRNPTSSLGTNTLDPHLCNERDWGGMVYLALSSYGATQGNQLPNAYQQIGGYDIKSTTGNKTGVINAGSNHWGITDTMVAGVLETGEANDETRSNLFLAQYSRYVDVLSDPIDPTNNKGMAVSETAGWDSASTNYPDYWSPVLQRYGFIGYYNYHGGSANSYGYRPVIWN